MEKITRETILSEVLEVPQVGEVLLKHKVPCLGCPFASLEMNQLTLGQISEMYGIDLKPLLKDLNKLSSKNDK